MLKKSYILNFIIDAKSNIWNKIFVISVLGLGGVVFDSVWGVIPPPERNTLWNKGRKCFYSLGAPNNLIRPCTDLDIQLTKTQLWLMGAFKNVRLLLDGCCSLSDKENEIFFGINISPPFTTIAGLDWAGQRLGLPDHRTSHQWTSSYGTTLKPWFTSRQLILKRLSFPFRLPRFRLCIEVGGRRFEHLL